MNPPEPGRVEFPPSHELAPVDAAAIYAEVPENIADLLDAAALRLQYFALVDSTSTPTSAERVKAINDARRGLDALRVAIVEIVRERDAARADYATSSFHEAVARRNAR